MPGNGSSSLKARDPISPLYQVRGIPLTLLVGIVGLLVAAMGFWYIPNFPHNTGTYFMSPEMSEMAQYRMIVSSGGRSEDDEGGAWEGVVLACKDPFTWIYTVIHFGLIVALSFKDFFPSVCPPIWCCDRCQLV